MRNVALITGASAGIGRELARVHAARGGDLVVVARRADRLEALRAEVEAEHGVRVLPLSRDLAIPGVADGLQRDLESRGIAVEFLINNAGFGVHGPFDHIDGATAQEMIQLNIGALVGLTRRFLPPMLERGHGRVLNVASMAGFLPGPFMSVYYATKAFVISFSEAIAEENSGSGVTVTALCPRATATEFAAVAGMEGSDAFADADPAVEVAAYGYEAMTRGTVIAIPRLVNRLKIQILRALPRRTVRRISRAKKER